MYLVLLFSAAEAVSVHARACAYAVCRCGWPDDPDDDDASCLDDDEDHVCMQQGMRPMPVRSDGDPTVAGFEWV